MSQADKDEANHLTKMILAYDALIDEADTIEQAERFEAEQDRLRAARNLIIWKK